MQGATLEGSLGTRISGKWVSDGSGWGCVHEMGIPRPLVVGETLQLVVQTDGCVWYFVGGAVTKKRKSSVISR